MKNPSRIVLFCALAIICLSLAVLAQAPPAQAPASVGESKLQ
mgnify:CR=1 FL=1